ncbi:MAG: hypothetical protein KA314_23070 [Chloroflexi bacterium]|nr:hypothetical protein [Chloroflexota bacterium]MBP8058726.1 hypothetical protein [Chloroflexota bacterium]
MTRLPIGFSQRVLPEWLEWTAQMALAGLATEAIYAELQNRLRPLVSVGGPDLHSTRNKVVNLLLNIWVKVPDALQPFRDEGLELLSQTALTTHLPVHWGMCLAAYPFFGTVVEAVGRLLQLQTTLTFAQIERRVQEKYGERETVRRAAQSVFYGLQDWGFLTKTDERMVFAGTKPLPLSDPRLTNWLVEAGMITMGVETVGLGAAAKMPVLFPFALPEPRIAPSTRLELFRQGLDNDVIMRIKP